MLLKHVLDYGESSYVGPIGVDQPNSQAWVNGFDHQGDLRCRTSFYALTFDPGWLVLIEYYSRAFKLGAYPPIIRDRIFLWSRPHPANLLNVPDNVSIPNNHEWVICVPGCHRSISFTFF